MSAPPDTHLASRPGYHHTVLRCSSHRPAPAAPPPPQIYPQVAPVLVQRFREREETVKADVFQVRLQD